VVLQLQSRTPVYRDDDIQPAIVRHHTDGRGHVRIADFASLSSWLSAVAPESSLGYPRYPRSSGRWSKADLTSTALVWRTAEAWRRRTGTSKIPISAGLRATLPFCIWTVRDGTATVPDAGWRISLENYREIDVIILYNLWFNYEWVRTFRLSTIIINTIRIYLLFFCYWTSTGRLRLKAVPGLWTVVGDVGTVRCCYGCYGVCVARFLPLQTRMVTSSSSGCYLLSVTLRGW